MTINRTLPAKDSGEGYETEFSRNADAADVRGVYVQDDASSDTSVLITRDGSGNMTFVDGVTTVKTLAQLATGGGGGSMATGTVDVDFGSVPGKDFVTVAVARASVTASTGVAASILPAETSDKSLDEHVIDSVEAFAHSVVAGVGFSVTVKSTAGLLLGKYRVIWLSTE